jgi:hypothetical protein
MDGKVVHPGHPLGKDAEMAECPVEQAFHR